MHVSKLFFTSTRTFLCNLLIKSVLQLRRLTHWDTSVIFFFSSSLPSPPLTFIYLWNMTQNVSGRAERSIFMTLHRGCWGVLLKWHFLPSHRLFSSQFLLGVFVSPCELDYVEGGARKWVCVSNCEVQFWWKCSLWLLCTLEIWLCCQLGWTTKSQWRKGVMIFYLLTYLAQKLRWCFTQCAF